MNIARGEQNLRLFTLHYPERKTRLGLTIAPVFGEGPVNTNLKTALQPQNGPGKARGEQFGDSK